MIVSMTGFGDASAEKNGTHYAVEIRSLNNRYFKPVIKLPDTVSGLEPELETMLREKLGRGSITYILKMRSDSAEAAYHINTQALKSYLEQLQAVKGLDRLVQIRQDRLRKAVPDALDLLVVCVEAGVSLDAAILRVARDLSVTHPDLAEEMMVINRKVNAGVPRETALNGLWSRTGLEELRGLAASMIQSERWGTSIAKVLRVNAETLRRRRKQYAEKKAAQASLKMMGPLLLFLLPALFIVILGPAAMNVSAAFK